MQLFDALAFIIWHTTCTHVTKQTYRERWDGGRKMKGKLARLEGSNDTQFDEHTSSVLQNSISTMDLVDSKYKLSLPMLLWWRLRLGLSLLNVKTFCKYNETWKSEGFFFLPFIFSIVPAGGSHYFTSNVDICFLKRKKMLISKICLAALFQFKSNAKKKKCEMLNDTYHPGHRENFSGRHVLKFYADEQLSRSTEPWNKLKTRQNQTFQPVQTASPSRFYKVLER